MTVTSQINSLPLRNCVLDEKSHKYFWDPGGLNEQMVTSVTSVINFFKPPYSGPPDAGPRGTHVHRWMYYKATGNFPSDLTSQGIDVLGTHTPEGIDCTNWIEILTNLSFWKKIEVMAAEYTMVNRKRSLGGQLDLLVRKENGEKVLIDLKTKSATWNGPTEKEKKGWMAQAGGYCDLLDSGDENRGGVWVDKAVTLVITPEQAVWVPGKGESYDMYECGHLWTDAWLTYLAYIEANPF